MAQTPPQQSCQGEKLSYRRDGTHSLRLRQNPCAQQPEVTAVTCRREAMKTQQWSEGQDTGHWLCQTLTTIFIFIFHKRGRKFESL